MSKRKVVVITSLLICVLLSVYPLVTVKNSEFAGADGKAEALILEIAPGYEPWATAIIEPPGGETESLLFALQAALGSGVFCFGMGYFMGRKKYEKKEEL